MDGRGGLPPCELPREVVHAALLPNPSTSFNTTFSAGLAQGGSPPEASLDKVPVIDDEGGTADASG